LDKDKWQSITECFVAVWFLKPAGTFAPAKDTTQLFAHLKYLARGVCIYQADQNKHLYDNDIQKCVV
jgi:hypothetical protein